MFDSISFLINLTFVFLLQGDGPGPASPLKLTPFSLTPTQTLSPSLSCTGSPRAQAARVIASGSVGRCMCGDGDGMYLCGGRCMGGGDCLPHSPLPTSRARICSGNYQKPAGGRCFNVLLLQRSFIVSVVTRY